MNPGNVTQLLREIGEGVPDAAHRLIELVHVELRAMAEQRMRAERPGHTLQATALVNEAYLRLAGAEHRLEDRAHFFGAAAKAMQRVLIDHAREKRALKRGGDAVRVTLSELALTAGGPDLDVFGVHAALDTLEAEDPELAALVRYRYFVGLTLEQIAEIQDVSLATAKRRWTFARAWLYERLQLDP